MPFGDERGPLRQTVAEDAAHWYRDPRQWRFDRRDQFVDNQRRSIRLSMNTIEQAKRIRRLLLRVPYLLMVLLLLLVSVPASPAAAQEIEPADAHQATISPQLAQKLAGASGPVSFLVVLREHLDATQILAANSLQSAGATQRRTALYAALTAHAERTQAPLRAWLDAAGVPYTPHYLANMIEVQGDASLAAQLQTWPEVDRLAANPAVQQTYAMPVTSAWKRLTTAEARATAAIPYGLTYTHADQVWALGFRGDGIVVGSQDTGVQWDHPALRVAYRGWDSTVMTATHAYNWFDAFGRDPLQDTRCSADAQVPCDDYGHGTHTVGTLVGDATTSGGTVLGMAPAAKWIGCRNMRNGVGTPASYITCFEWLLAPYPQGGDPFRDGKPELAADIVNNSWGCPPQEGCDAESLRQVVDTVRAAGIFIAASAGNEGWYGCSTVSSPIAIYDSSFTTGAHDAQGNVSPFSSRGPVTVDGSGRMKPDISAPGSVVYSTYPTNTYANLSGTSMASPHVAGAVALLWSAVPTLAGDIERTEDILRKSATPVAVNTCGASFTPVSPNNVYGHGRLDILAAVTMARQPVTLTISLVTSDSLPVAGRTIEVVEQRTAHTYSGVTDANGQVTWAAEQAQLWAGSYTVRAQGCITLADAGSIELALGQAASKTIITASYICRILPFISR